MGILLYISTIMKIVIILLTQIIFISCGVNHKKHTVETKNQELKTTGKHTVSDSIGGFDHFVSYFSAIPLLKANFSYNSEEMHKTETDIKSKYRPEGSTIIGRLKPVDGNYFIIYRYPADILLPILEIYNEKGEQTTRFELLDYAWCADELAMNYGRFTILNDTMIFLENYVIHDGDTVITKTNTLNLKQIISAGKMDPGMKE